MLTKLKVEYCYSAPPTDPASQFPVLSIISQQNNLCSLSLISLSFSSVETHSLFLFWQSPHSRLQKMSLKDCTISMNSDNHQQTEVKVFIIIETTEIITKNSFFRCLQQAPFSTITSTQFLHKHTRCYRAEG